jgi:hypothetical protein
MSKDDKPATEPAQAPREETRTARAWSKQCGTQAWAYAAAAAVHGWREHAYHDGAPMQLSLKDYQAAIEAAVNFTGAVKPHTAALSKHQGKGV